MGGKTLSSRDFRFTSGSANGRLNGLNFRRRAGLILLRPAHLTIAQRLQRRRKPVAHVVRQAVCGRKQRSPLRVWRPTGGVAHDIVLTRNEVKCSNLEHLTRAKLRPGLKRQFQT